MQLFLETPFSHLVTPALPQHPQTTANAQRQQQTPQPNLAPPNPAALPVNSAPKLPCLSAFATPSVVLLLCVLLLPVIFPPLAAPAPLSPPSQFCFESRFLVLAEWLRTNPKGPNTENDELRHTLTPTPVREGCSEEKIQPWELQETSRRIFLLQSAGKFQPAPPPPPKAETPIRNFETEERFWRLGTAKVISHSWIQFHFFLVPPLTHTLRCDISLLSLQLGIVRICKSFQK
jgi:hypothetical protein